MSCGICGMQPTWLWGEDSRAILLLCLGHTTISGAILHMKLRLLSNHMTWRWRVIWGTASTAIAVSAAGVKDSMIKTLVWWLSSAYQTYMRIPRESLAAVSKKLSEVWCTFMYTIPLVFIRIVLAMISDNCCESRLISWGEVGCRLGGRIEIFLRWVAESLVG